MFTICKAHTIFAKELADIHALGFVTPWDQSTIRNKIEDETVLSFSASYGMPARLVGFIFIRHILDEADVLTVVVKPNMRHKGIGFGLFHSALRSLDEKGVKTVHLEVSAKNQNAIKLYEKLGFLQVGVRPNYYAVHNRKNEDALRMKLDMENACFQFEPATYIFQPF